MILRCQVASCRGDVYDREYAHPAPSAAARVPALSGQQGPLNFQDRTSDSSWVHIRWPFLAALLTVIVGIGGWAALPSVRQAWQDHQLRKAAEKDFDRLRPATALLLRMTPPSGVTNCASDESSRKIGMVCWDSEGTVPNLTVTLAHELRAIGATDVVARCVTRPHIGNLCTLKGRVAGLTFAALVGPQVNSDAASAHPYHGARAHGDLVGLAADMTFRGPAFDPEHD